MQLWILESFKCGILGYVDGLRIKFHNHISLKFNYLYDKNENLLSITSISVNAPNIFNVQSLRRGPLPFQTLLTYHETVKHSVKLTCSE